MPAKEAVTKVLETLKVVVGVIVPISAIWNFLVPFNPESVKLLLDIIIGIIGGGTLVASGVRGYFYVAARGKSRNAYEQ